MTRRELLAALAVSPFVPAVVAKAVPTPKPVRSDITLHETAYGFCAFSASPFTIDDLTPEQRCVYEKWRANLMHMSAGGRLYA
jgi:hypothetical protein